MTKYFDLTEGEDDEDPPARAACLALLPKDLRDWEDLVTVAANCEADVIAAYTAHIPHRDWPGFRYMVNIGTDLYVRIRGFTEDASAQTDARIIAAMRREIAGMIRWRKGQIDKRPLIQGAGGGDPTASLSFRPDAEEIYPPGFGTWLRPYEVALDSAVI